MEKQPWWLRWSRKLEEEENGGSCCCCTTWWRKIRAHGGSDRFEQGEIELPAAASLWPLPTDGERVRERAAARKRRVRESESESESYCCCWGLLVRECAMSEREESVKCVHACMFAVLPATGKSEE